ncbi:MAG: F0F1 ATP synthase subunit A [Deltaproteobacteria bacterium]|nr:F0F1 ATP synthase subunit A [Deltaproteobacteria bacterium]
MEEHGLTFPTIPGLPVHTSFMIYSSVLLIIFSFIVRGSLALVPGKLQNIVEYIIEGFSRLAEDMMGHKGKAYLPLVLTLFLYILVSNSFGLFPTLVPPTANLNTTLALALMVFILTHIVGLKEHGFAYIKHFLGPMPILAPIMFPIEVFGHLARPVSLSMRLFGNIFGHELLVFSILGLMPYAYPLLAFVTVLGVLTVVIQAFIFSLLTMAYLGGAIEEAH